MLSQRLGPFGHLRQSNAFLLPEVVALLSQRLGLFSHSRESNAYPSLLFHRHCLQGESLETLGCPRYNQEVRWSLYSHNLQKYEDPSLE